MKKTGIQFVITFTLIASISHAQDSVIVYPHETVNAPSEQLIVVRAVPVLRDSRTKFYVGLKGGYNYANVYDEQGERFNTNPKIGFAAGVFFTIPIGKFLGIQPEVLFSQKGFNATGSLLENTYRIKRTSNFIDVPLLVALKPVSFITLLAGPQFSYLIKQRDEFTGSQTDSLVEEEFRNDNIRKTMLCFLGGFDFNFTHLVVGARVGWDVKQNLDDENAITPRYKNTWIQATLGVRL